MGLCSAPVSVGAGICRIMKHSTPQTQPLWAGRVQGDFASLLWVPPCALLLLAAFPPWNLTRVAWVAAAPLTAGLLGDGGQRSSPAAWCAAGWGYGLLYYGVQFAWLPHTFVTLGGMGWLHFVNFYALVGALLALVPAAVLGGTAWLRERWGLSPLVALPVLLAAQDALLGVFPFGGMGWGSPAGPQAGTWAARWVVPALGGPGLVLLMGMIGAGWGAWGLSTWRAGGLPQRSLAAARGYLAWGAVWGALTLACAWPAPVPPVPPGAKQVPVLLVPGQLTIAELNAQRGTPAPLRYYLGRTLQALEATPAHVVPPRLVVWPESAVPGDVEHGKSLVALSEVGGVMGADLLLGSNAMEFGREYNSLYLVNGGRFDFWRYDKQRLVPFGEYVPAGFRWLFPRKVTHGTKDYAAGHGAPVLDWRGTRLGLAICFESILPQHARAAANAGAALLVTAANDEWLTPAARREHLQLTALQALAVGRDALFVANGGWSALLRGGRAVEAETGGRPLRVSPALRHGRTLYARWGLLPLAGIGLLLLAAGWLARKRPRDGP